ncbi:MAG: hypothetical protein NTW16_13960 [Bacteroidetes bacterium]|nr:hypothetical protein [Bacteroidota bacterium]
MSIAFWTSAGSWNSTKFNIRDNIFSRQKWYAIVNTSGSTGSWAGNLNISHNLFNQWYLVDSYYPANASQNEWPATRGAVGWNSYDATPAFTNNLQADPIYQSSGTTAEAYYTLTSGSPARAAASDGTDIGAWQAPVNKWKGTVSTDWNTPANWTANTVPASDANIIFDDAPLNHCLLDQNRSVTNISNAQSVYRVALNGKRLILKGNLNFTNSAQLDASATGSALEFAGSAAQSIPSGALYNNEAYDLIVNNPNNVVLNGTLHLLNTLIAASGQLDASTNAPTVTYSDAVLQTIESNLYLNDKTYNLTIENPNGVTLRTDFTIENSLTINSGTTLTIAPAIKLNVVGSITNNAGASGLVLQSNSAGTASLLHHTDNVSATVQRYFSGTTEAWHFLSSPVADQNIGANQGSSDSWLPSGSYPNGTGYDLYIWDEPTSTWIYKLDVISPVNWNTLNPGSDFVAGRGYLYAFQAVNPTKTFTGHLNNGLFNYPLTASSSIDSLKGFMVVGNPYPSEVDWQAISGWTRSSLVSSGGGVDMWIYNPAASNYGVCNSIAGSTGTNSITRYIAPMQGYVVRSSGAGTLTIDNPVRVLSDANWFKGLKQDDNRISLCVKSDAGSGFDEIQLNFGYSSNQNGAMKLFSTVATAPSLYMANQAENLSVRYCTNTNDNSVVPVRFDPGIDGDYTMESNFNPGQFDTVVLEDRQTHVSQNMKAARTYRFHSSKTDNPDRFILRFGPDTRLIIDLVLIPEETEVCVYDAIGRLLLQQKLAGGVLHYLVLDADAQLLIVSLKNPAGALCRKLLW